MKTPHSVLLGLMVVGFFIAGCVSSIPVEDYTLARAAYEAARDSDSIRYAPGLWHKADQSYKEGQRLFADRRYEEAKAMFKQARIMSERAETAAAIARFQSGDLPQ